MDLRSHSPYWLLRQGLLYNFPSLNQNISTDIVIIGAGISGALTARYLYDAGFKVVIVDRRHAGTGSTVASTSLLQYEIDTPLQQLIKLVGEKKAIDSYLLCRRSVYTLRDICAELHDNAVFKIRPSFQFASFKKEVNDLKKEYLLRKKIGIDLEWLEKTGVEEKFSFTKPAGILSKDGAESDAFTITQLILKKYQKKGLEVYDNTEISKIRTYKNEIELTTADNKKIKAKKLIIACGYESQRYIPQKIERLASTFAIASEPIPQKKLWYKNAIIWETAQPYLYFRTTQDNRIIVGGKDVPFTSPRKRDQLLSSKSKALKRSFESLFPNLLFKIDFSWAGTFASTKDGLPYIGMIPQRPHTYFALGFGGNGILFSVIAAELIRDSLIHKKNPYKDLFSFDR